MFFRLYILIERNNLSEFNILGIYNFNDALEKKSTYESVNIDKTYTIEGPFEYNHNLDEKPNSFLKPLNHNFDLKPPNLNDKIKKVNSLPPIDNNHDNMKSFLFPSKKNNFNI